MKKWRCVYKCKLQRLLDETVLTAQDRRQGSREAAADLCFYEKIYLFISAALGLSCSMRDL